MHSALAQSAHIHTQTHNLFKKETSTFSTIVDVLPDVRLGYQGISELYLTVIPPHSSSDPIKVSS